MAQEPSALVRFDRYQPRYLRPCLRSQMFSVWRFVNADQEAARPMSPSTRAQEEDGGMAHRTSSA